MTKGERTDLATPRERLLEARQHLSRAFEIIDDVAPGLPAPERGALVGILGARHDLARIIRQLGTIATSVGTITSAEPTEV